jgi:putative transposase
MHQQEYAQDIGQDQLGTIKRVPDGLWEQMEAVLPPEKPAGTPGRPPVPYRTVMNGILYVLRTGCQWNMVPEEFSSGSTVHRRFQEWVACGAFDEIVKVLLHWYAEQKAIDWEWQSGDTKLLAAPLGGEKTGPNPTDRGKLGTKRHLLIDGRGVPLALHLSAAHQADNKGLKPLVTDGWLVDRPSVQETGPQHICLDKAYDDQKLDQLLRDMGYTLHIKRRGDEDEIGIGEPVHPARRWKVERTISWLNNMRKLRTRWAKKASNYRALWLLAIALVIFRRTVLG